MMHNGKRDIIDIIEESTSNNEEDDSSESTCRCTCCLNDCSLCKVTACCCKAPDILTPELD